MKIKPQRVVRAVSEMELRGRDEGATGLACHSTAETARLGQGTIDAGNQIGVPQMTAQILVQPKMAFAAFTGRPGPATQRIVWIRLPVDSGVGGEDGCRGFARAPQAMINARCCRGINAR